MSHKVLDAETLVLALPLEHDLMACEEIQWTALSGQLLLFSMFDGGTDLAHICANVLGAHEIVPLDEVLPVLPDSLFHLVAPGRGASILPLSAYPTARQDVVIKPIAAPDQSMLVSLFWCPHNTRPEAWAFSGDPHTGCLFKANVDGFRAGHETRSCIEVQLRSLFYIMNV